MKNGFQRLLAAAVAVLSLALSLASTGTAHAAVPSVWTDWLNSLRSQGFAVTQGIATKHDCLDLIEVFGDCIGTNPASLYADVLVPVDGAYVDPCYNGDQVCNGQNIFTKTVTPPSGTTVSASQFYRLSDNQALVVIVKLPPNGAYFGYQNYVWSRANSQYGEGCAAGRSGNYPNPCRTLVRASVANALNHVSIQRQSGQALGSGATVAFVTTSNKALYESLTAAFAHAGGDPRLLLLEPLGARVTAGLFADGIETGLDEAGDELNALVRYALPEEPAQAENWLNSVADNIQVFRIHGPDAPVTLFSTVRIAPKDSTSGEATYQPALGELVSSLKAWLQTSKVSTVKTSEMTGGLYTRSGLPLAAPVGTICLQQAEDCRRTTDDTDAYRSKPIGTLRETALVVGIDSTQTGNAHYLSLGVTRGDVLEGVYALSQTNPQAAGFDRGTLRGSASDFVTDLLSRKLIAPPSADLAAALPKLYVAIITRDCPAMAAAFFCAKDYVVQLDPAALPEDVNVVLTARAYIHPGDTNGANPRFLLSPVVIK